MRGKGEFFGKWAGQDSNLRGALPRGCFTGTFLRPLGHRPGVVNGSGGIRTRRRPCGLGAHETPALPVGRRSRVSSKVRAGFEPAWRVGALVLQTSPFGRSGTGPSWCSTAPAGLEPATSAFVARHSDPTELRGIVLFRVNDSGRSRTCNKPLLRRPPLPFGLPSRGVLLSPSQWRRQDSNLHFAASRAAASAVWATAPVRCARKATPAGFEPATSGSTIRRSAS